ncbi:IS30 family transposase [Liquorilactobacillus satsumensis]|nr:IS30 family transposase [Liquorilactobacillus satsumensis]MCP9372529.1 IS30 family transposase [Liquorilactobacillus satsumensis]
MINAEVIIAKQSDLRHGQVTPQRWVIERSFSWLGKYRRLWRNCERKLNTSRMMISLAFLRILLKRFQTRSKAVLLTLIAHKSRFLWAYRLKDRTTVTVNEALTKFLTTFNGPVHSFTVDRSTEFSGLVSLESQYGIKTYYCHAYTPAERGSNERFNRNLRYFYPKGTRFEHISAQDLTTTLLQINQRPLKILDWQTPYQVMLTNLSKNSD